MRNQTANETEERKAIATIEDVLKNTQPQNYYWEKIKKLVMPYMHEVEEMGEDEELDILDKVAWDTAEEHIEATLYSTGKVDIEDNGGVGEYDSTEEAYEVLKDEYWMRDNPEEEEEEETEEDDLADSMEVEEEEKAEEQEQEKEMEEEAEEEEETPAETEEPKTMESFTVHSLEELKGIDNKLVADPAFQEFAETVYFNIKDAKPTLGIGEEYFEAYWETGKYLLVIDFWYSYDPEEYHVWTVTLETEEEERKVAHVLGEFDSPDEAISCARDYEKRQQKKAARKSQKKADKEETPAKEKNEFGHGIGTIADKIDKMLMQGVTTKEAEEAGIKAMRFHVHYSTMKREKGDTIKFWKEGNKYFAALK